MKKYLWPAASAWFLYAVTVFGLATAAGVETLPYYDSPEFTPHWLTPGSAAINELHRIPAFSFTNQYGDTVTETDVAGGIYVASFFFSTCPGICPRIRSKLSVVQERFIDDDSVTLLSHSIRPQTDSVAVLRDYAKAHGVVGGKWHLLTGDRETLYDLARNAYFANEDLGEPAREGDFLHTENVLLIDQNRHIRGIYNGLSETSVEHLISDIEHLQKELRATASR